MLLVLILTSFLLAAAGVWFFRRATARSTRLLDRPNERSSHSVPVTRGAGLAIVVVVVGLYICLFWDESDRAFVIAAVLIAGVGLLDDIFSTPLVLRLAVQIAAASLFVHFSGSYTGIALPWSGGAISFGSLSAAISVIFIVWVTNAFNFMDGVDGLAGIQGVGTAVGWLLLGVTLGSSSYTLLGAIIIGSCAGFLLFNWQPAKVFMGDVGSTFLGFTFAAFPLIDGTGQSPIGSYGFAPATIFLWLFLFDTVFTRTRQIIQLKPFWRAHRDHLYQRIVIGGSSHRAVAVFFGCFAVAAAIGIYFARDITFIPLGAVLVLGPTSLLRWSWKKRLT